jgi:hypothetical protein
MNEEKKRSNITVNLDDINSALTELDSICEVSSRLFGDVLHTSSPTDSCDNEKCSPSSSLSGVLQNIRDRIVCITNKYIDFNSRCDL